MDEYNIFIRNTDILLAQYIVSKLKKIVRQFEKSVFKIVTSADILSNIQILNSGFMDKVKHTGIDKAYKKSRLLT